jgi:tetratricopeptide (TPR) repeat protein
VGEAAFAGADQLACFSWSEADDSIFRPLLEAETDLSDQYNARDTEREAELDFYARDWAAFLQLGTSASDQSLIRSMLSDEDPAGYFRQRVLPHLPTGVVSRSEEVQRYLTMMSRAADLDAAADSWSPRATSRTGSGEWRTLFVNASAAMGGKGLPSFLQSRFAYLALRAATRSGSPQKALDIYQNTFAGKPGSLLRFKAWSYAAHAALQLGDVNRAASWYLAILDQFPALQFAMQESLGFLNLSDAAWDALSASLPKGHRRAVAAFTRALSDPHLETTRYMELIDAEEPGSPHLGKLLIRSVRAIDAVRLPRVLAVYAAPGSVFSPAGAAPSGGASMQFDDGKLEALLSFTRGVIARDKEWNPGLWLAAEVHLALLLGRAADAASIVDGARSVEGRFSPSARGALAVERLLTALALTWPDEKLQPLVPDALTALDEIAKEGDTAPRAAVFGALGIRRLAQGDVPRAILAFTVAGYTETVRFMLDMYATPEHLQSLERVVAAPTENESAAGAARFPFKTIDLEYMRGVRLLRSGSFEGAARVLGSLPASFWRSPGARKSDNPFNESYTDAPLYSVQITEGDTTDAKVKPRLLRRDALARRLAELARSGDTTTLGWIFLSTPFAGYDDLLWKGEMVEVLKRASLDGGWPFVTRDLSARALERMNLFLDEYDSNGIASRYLKASLDTEKAPERAARLALGLWRSLTDRSYAEGIGSSPRAAAADASALAAMIARKYGRTAVVKDYRSGFDDGCPGLEVTR